MHLTFYEREQFSHLQKSILKRNKHYITLHYYTIELLQTVFLARDSELDTIRIIALIMDLGRSIFFSRTVHEN